MILSLFTMEGSGRGVGTGRGCGSWLPGWEVCRREERNPPVLGFRRGKGQQSHVTAFSQGLRSPDAETQTQDGEESPEEGRVQSLCTSIACRAGVHQAHGAIVPHPCSAHD